VFIWTSVLSLMVFLISFIMIFKGRKHPYTILAYSGAVSFSILAFELLHIIQFDWRTLIVLPFAMGMSWFSFRLSKKVKTGQSKKLIIQSLIPTLFVFVYVFLLNFWFLFPMFIMTLFIPLLIPTRIKKQRRNLFV
jgi:hypothetical protein